MANIATGLDYLTKFVGICGGLLGAAAFIHTRRMKALDLRVQLRNQQHDLQAVVDGLKGLMARAAQSRTNLSAAIGHGLSGAMQVWNQQYEKDLAELAALTTSVENLPQRFAGISFGELENRMVELHRLNSRATRLKGSYDASLAEDDASRIQIKADHRAITAARMRGEH